MTQVLLILLLCTIVGSAYSWDGDYSALFPPIGYSSYSRVRGRGVQIYRCDSNGRPYWWGERYLLSGNRWLATGMGYASDNNDTSSSGFQEAMFSTFVSGISERVLNKSNSQVSAKNNTDTKSTTPSTTSSPQANGSFKASDVPTISWVGRRFGYWQFWDNCFLGAELSREQADRDSLNNIPWQLFEYRRGHPCGTCSQVGYVQRVRTRGGQWNATCTSNQQYYEFNFEAEYLLWRRDNYDLYREFACPRRPSDPGWNRRGNKQDKHDGREKIKDKDVFEVEDGDNNDNEGDYKSSVPIDVDIPNGAHEGSSLEWSEDAYNTEEVL